MTCFRFCLVPRLTDFKPVRFKTEMWFRLGFGNFIGKKSVGPDSCDIFISDFSRIWHKSLSNDELISISKVLNPLVEASVQKLKEVTLNLLEDVAVQKEIIEDDENQVFLKLQSHDMGVKFRFEVLLKLQDGDVLYKEFTIPLLLLLMKLQNREKKLIKIIQDKDAEIRDYKQEYGDRASYLATKPFNQKEFNCHESEPSASWDPSSFLDCITTKVLSLEGAVKVTEGEQPSQEESGKKRTAGECDKNKLIFRDKSLNSNKGSKPCVLLDNQTIKKRRKQKDGFKIKF